MKNRFMASKPQLAEFDQTVAATAETVDAVAREMDSKWGVNRLLRSCPDAGLRERMERQLQKFNAAIWESDDAATVRAHGTGVVKGWQALERAAVAAGMEPLTAGREIETAMDDGSVLVIVPSVDRYVRRTGDDRAMIVIAADAVAQLLRQQSETVKAVMREFPGAAIESVRPIDWSKGDDIPF